MHMAIKIENQVKRRGSSNTRSTPGPSSSAWKSNQWRKEEKPPNAKHKTELKQEGNNQGNQGKSDSFTTRNCDIMCFKRICDANFYNIYWEFNLNYRNFRFGRLCDGSMAKKWSADPLEIPLGIMTLARAKRLKEALHVLIREAHVEKAHVFNSKKETKMVHVIKLNPDLDQEPRHFLTC